MKQFFSITCIAITILLSACSKQEKPPCEVSEELLQEIQKAISSKEFGKEDMSKIFQLYWRADIENNANQFKDCDFNTKEIDTLFHSDNDYKKTFAYVLIGMGNVDSYHDEMIKRLYADESPMAKQWNGTILMQSKAKNASEGLFDLLLNEKDIATNILSNIYVKYDSVNVLKTAKKRLHSSDFKTQLLAARCASFYERDEKLIGKLKEFLETWDIQYKGFAVACLEAQKAANLKALVTPYIETEDEGLKEIILRALEASPTPEDQDYAKELRAK